MARGGVTVKDAAVLSGLGKVADGLGDMSGTEASAAELVAADARARAPKRTAALSRSITARAGVVGTPIRYGIPVHFGVPSRNQRPQPFLAAAVTAQTSNVVAVYARDVQHLIDGAM